MRLPSRKAFTKDRMLTLLLFLPTVVLVGYFIYGSIGWNALVSVSDWTGLRPSFNIVGFGQYTALFSDPVFYTSLKNNVILTLLFVHGSILVGLFLAILLDQNVRAEGVFRTIYLLPFALSFVVTATLWAWMFNPEIGVINTLFGKIGLGFLKSGWITEAGMPSLLVRLGLFSFMAAVLFAVLRAFGWMKAITVVALFLIGTTMLSASVALYSIILALIWQFSGYAMLIFLAGIRTIPESQIRAAEVDGASGFNLYRRVVIPQLKTPFFTTFVVLMIFAFKAFDFIYVLTSGGPGWSTYVLPLMMYMETFGKTHFAYGAAIATVLFLLVIAVVIPYLYLTYRRE